MSKQWINTERAVALIEAALQPTAIVSHDVKLPDRVTGHPRQCDVVITLRGNPKLFGIVEVQDRRAPVSIGELESWWQKKVNVGADWLICVSRRAYPKSVTDAVRLRYGPSVILMTLKQVVSGEFPANFPADPELTLRRVAINQPVTMALHGDPNDGSTVIAIEETDRCWKRDGAAQPSTMREIVDSELTRLGMPSTAGKYQRQLFVPPERPLYVLDQGMERRVLQLVIPVVLTVKVRRFSRILSQYVQTQADAVLAWCATIQVEMGGEQVNVQEAFVPNNLGGFDVMVASDVNGQRLSLSRFLPVRVPGGLRVDYKFVRDKNADC